MKKAHGVMVFSIVLLCCSWISQAQQTLATSTNAVVPPLVKFGGVLTDVNGKPLSGVVGVTFALYKDEQGGAPLWLETQNVTPDRTGHYSVMLGSTSSTGLPTDLFASGEAHWLGVQAEGQAEQPRVLLMSVPYALKAGDAQTLGGLPASAFVLAAPSSGAMTATPASDAAAANTSVTPATTSDVTTTGGTVDAIPLFSTATNIQNSILTQTGTTEITVAGRVNLPATGTATATAGKDSQAQDFVASVFNSSTSTAVPQKFQWQAEPAGNDTSSASGTLNLLFASGTATPAETGLKVSHSGLITFASGQTFPGTGPGTITGVTAGTDLTGGGTSGNVTLNLDTTKVPLLSAANTFIGNQAITGNLTDTGNITATGAITGQTGSFSVNSSTTAALTVTQSGGADGVYVNAPSAYYGLYVNGDAIGALGNAVAKGGDGVYGNATGGNGVYGIDIATSGASVGVYGQSNSSSGYGVEGTSANVGVFGSGTGSGGIGLDGHGTFQGAKGISTTTTGAAEGLYGQSSSTAGYGVYGTSPNIGAYGQADGASAAGSGLALAGIWGDTGGASDAFSGVMGTADDNNAGFFVNNSGSDASIGGATLLLENGSTDSSALLFYALGGVGNCEINNAGTITCNGTAVNVVKAGAREVSLYAMHSPENWFEDFGSGTLVNGSTTVALDPTFAATVDTTNEYHVFLTPNGDCKGLYVSQKSAGSFEVRELGGGQSSVSFDYRIVAKRAGYENLRLADVTERQRKMREQQQLRLQRMQQRRAAPSVAAPTAPPVVAAPLVPAASAANAVPSHR